MTAYFLKNTKLLIISILSIFNFGLLTNKVEAQPTNKSLKPNSKVSSLKPQNNLSLELHLILSGGVTNKTETTDINLKNSFEQSQIEPTISIKNQPLMASAISGRASWYGPKFHGRLTASGEVFNQNALTAAHPSLRFGTRVKVTNLNNGRSVIVRINDRGPYTKGRIIDVSAAAARSLGMIRSGVARVRVTILGR